MKRFILITCIILCVLCSCVSADDTPPPMPYIVYGHVEDSDIYIPHEGSVVRIVGEGVEYGFSNPILVYQHNFGGPTAIDDKLIVQGDITPGAALEVYVDDYRAFVNRNGSWINVIVFQPGVIERLELKVIDIPTTVPTTITTTPPTTTITTVPTTTSGSSGYYYGGGGGGGGSYSYTTTPTVNSTTYPTQTSNYTANITTLPTTSQPVITTAVTTPPTTTTTIIPSNTISTPVVTTHIPTPIITKSTTSDEYNSTSITDAGNGFPLELVIIGIIIAFIIFAGIYYFIIKDEEEDPLA